MGSNGHGTSSTTRALAIFGAGAAVLHGWRLSLSLFGAATRYGLDRGGLPPIDSAEFQRYVSTITESPMRPETRISVLRNGPNFYAAELEAIRGAGETVNLEAYGFLEGKLAREFLDALTNRARAGVEVRLVLDAIGSWNTPSRYFDRLCAAGGRVSWYHPVKSKNWPYLNNRTHRKLLVVDGRVGFIGGAGFADHWIKPGSYGPPWRDTILRTEGGAVPDLNAVFAENWLETTGEILTGQGHFRFTRTEGGVPAMVIRSTPHGGATRARMLYQIMIEAATRSIYITTPYFVPDRSARQSLTCAAERGVDVVILTAGPHNDHSMTRGVSRMFERPLAKAGVAIYEYLPAMIHAKLMCIDGLWTVAGSTNFDHRSFDLNDEVNLVVADRGIAAEIERDFAGDLAHSRRLTPKSLKNPGVFDRVVEDASWVLRRQQ